MAMRSIRNLPWIPFAAQRFIEATILRPESRVFEFGSGGSTIWWAKRAAHVISVENCSEWLERVQNKLDEWGVADKCELLHRATPEYAAAISDYGMFDIVFVDGEWRHRCRQKCMRRAKPHVKPGGYMILDNPNMYPPPKRLLEDWECYKFYGYGMLTHPGALRVNPEKWPCWIWRNVTEENCREW